jgi:anti-anti-sigma regulatory factor
MEEVNVMAASDRGTFRIEIGGEFDDAAAQRLARTLGEADFPHETRVDFSRARSVDMRALYVLAGALHRLRRRVLLVGLSHRDSRLLGYLGVHERPAEQDAWRAYPAMDRAG